MCPYFFLFSLDLHLSNFFFYSHVSFVILTWREREINTKCGASFCGIDRWYNASSQLSIARRMLACTCILIMKA
jgi:hypothetical protein